MDIQEKELPIINLPLKGKTDYGEIILMGDFHVGSEGFSEHQLVAYIKWVKANPHVRVILMGDLLEMASLSHYTKEQKETSKQQLATVISLLRPIKDQIICILEGNHEERFSRIVDSMYTIPEIIADKLGMNKVILVGPQKGAVLVLKTENQYYPIYVIHGHTGAIVNKGTQLKRMAFTTKVPLIAHGHTHTIYHDHYVYRSVSKVKGKFYESIFQQHWVSTGCFVKYLGYAEQRSYPMTKIGAPIIRLYSKKENMMIIDDARSFYKIGMEYPDNLSDSPADNKILEAYKKELGIKKEEIMVPKSEEDTEKDSENLPPNNSQTIIKKDSENLPPEGENQ